MQTVRKDLKITSELGGGNVASVGLPQPGRHHTPGKPFSVASCQSLWQSLWTLPRLPESPGCLNYSEGSHSGHSGVSGG